MCAPCSETGRSPSLTWPSGSRKNCSASSRSVHQFEQREQRRVTNLCPSYDRSRSFLINRKCLLCPTWTICICLWWHLARTTRQHPSIPQCAPPLTGPPQSLRITCQSGLTPRSHTWSSSCAAIRRKWRILQQLVWLSGTRCQTEVSWGRTELKTAGAQGTEKVPLLGSLTVDHLHKTMCN